ncbi:unnamed protein product [Arctia plantaginis]|uniref:Uncharacterized protein n=1 Tax=Arctia plantaginis TaxID=874455 RepID=A0A8S1AUY9_ARCPL|nr:unnamed protein product [Arctia plantaginis]
MIIRKSIIETLKEFWHTTSIGGIKQIRNLENSKFERVCYIAIFCITFTTACLFLRYTWDSTFTTPLIVTAESFTYPIKDIDFPAVALCNFNRISKKALEEYSLLAMKKSLKSGRRNVTLIQLRDYLQSYGKLIDYLYDGNLQRIIDDALLDELEINIPNLMQKLSPRCDEMLIKCKWAGREVNCSEIFHTRRTGLGHCCAFNYVLDMNSADRPSKTIAPVKRQKVPGPHDGLLVIADPMPEDDVYQKAKRNGFQVLIYDPRQFPEMSGGKAQYRIAQPNQVDVLQIKSIKQYAAPEVHNYPRSTV